MAYDRTRPSLTENNRIYLYRLLKEAIGCGKQTFITAVDEALATNELVPVEIGYASTRALLEELSDFVKLTVFKGGRIYATLSAVPAWDEALAQPEKAAAKDAGAKGKSWKKKKGAKALKPQRPKRIKRAEPEPAAAPEPELKAEAVPEPTSAPELEQKATPAPTATAEAAPAKLNTGEPMANADAQTAPAGGENPAEEPAHAAEDAQKPAADETATTTDSEPRNTERDEAAESKGVVQDECSEAEAENPAGPPKTLSELLAAINDAEQSLENTGEAEGSVDKAEPQTRVEKTLEKPAPATHDDATATAVKAPANQDDAAAAPIKAAAEASGATHASQSTRGAKGAKPKEASPANPATPPEQPCTAPAFDFEGYPVDFSREVFCPGNLLAEISALLPWGADALGIVGEYYWIARENGTIEATRSRASFAVRYTRDGARHEATVGIKRKNGRDGATWAIDSIVQDEPTEN